MNIIYQSHYARVASDHRASRVKKISTKANMEGYKGRGGIGHKLPREIMQASLNLHPGQAVLYVTDGGNMCRIYRREDFPEMMDFVWNPDD